MQLSIPVEVSECTEKGGIWLPPQIAPGTLGLDVPPRPLLIFYLSLFYNEGKWQKQRQNREMIDPKIVPCYINTQILFLIHIFCIFVNLFTSFGR